MNRQQKEIAQEFLNSEKQTIKELKDVYKKALRDTEIRIAQLSARTDMENIQTIIYQKRYQDALKAQLEGVLEELHSNEYATVSDYLTRCYQDGYIGTLYDISGQGMPLILPMDQEQIVKAIQTDTKLSKTLYETLGEDVKDLKKAIRSEISRGIASGSTWNEVAGMISLSFQNSPFNKAYNRSVTIARTEGHRIQVAAQLDAQKKAKTNGCDVVKQWDATLDGATRPTHRELDGKIVEVDDKFEYSGGSVEAPGHFGDPAEDCNCRCMLLQKAKWALDESELETFKERASYFELDKTKDFAEYKKKFLKVSERVQSGVQKMKIEFPEDVYKIKGFTQSVKNEVDNAIKKLETEYDIRLNSIVVEQAGKGDIFVTGYHDGIVDMVVNENADFENVISRISKKYESGYFAGKSLEDYIAHEMAHCMLYQDCDSDAKYHAKYKQIESLYIHLQGISGYADRTKSGNEALAEAFVRVRNNENVPHIAKVLVESYFGKWKK